MRVEVNEGQWSSNFLGIRAQQRVTDVMVTAKGEHGGAAVQNGARMFDDGWRDRFRRMRVEPAVAVIRHGQILERVKPPRKRLEFRQLDTGRANRRRAKTRPGPVRGRQIERHAAHDYVRTGDVARVLSSHEAENAAEGILDAAAR